MSVNDESEHPWLVAEKRLIREAVQAGVGYWGACLGVQLLASSLGARVYAGPQPEVGVLGVTLTDEGASAQVFAGLPRELATLQWHAPTFALPAVSPSCQPTDMHWLHWVERMHSLQTQQSALRRLPRV